MNSSVLTIPIEDVFNPKCGCPVCRMYKMLEERFIEYIMGAAMMEPDIRIMTNKFGFCKDHYALMLKKNNKLSLALMLESHLEELNKNIFKKSTLLDKNAKVKSAKTSVFNCFVCDNIKSAMDNLIKATLRMYANDESFKNLFNEQEYICLPHFAMLCESAEHSFSKKTYPQFLKDATALCGNYISSLTADVHHFTTMFDYRNSGPDADWGNSKDAVERAINYLTSSDC